jgi:hypothetical protein
MAGIASAATLNWEGTFVLDMVHLGKGVATGGGVATVNSSGGGIPAHINTLRLAASRGQFTGSSFDIVTDPEQAGNGIAAVAFEGIQGGTGTFFPISGGAASTTNLTQHIMPVYGVSKVCLLNTSCTTALTLPFTAPTTVNGVPGTGIQGLGIGGMLTMGGYGGIRMSMHHAPWTIKTVTAIDHITTTGGGQIFIDIVQKGWAHAPASTTSSTGQVGGMVQLVTPNQVETNLALGSNNKVGSTVVFVMRFIPEPGLLMLLGSGVAGLALLGRKRMRS